MDAGGWRAALDRRDQHHEAARRLFKRAASEQRPLITSNLVIAEVQRLTLFRAGPRASALAMTGVLGTHRLQLEFASPEHHRRALEWIGKLHDQDISYTDACSFALMEQFGIRVVLGFDQHFRVAGFQLAGDGSLPTV